MKTKKWSYSRVSMYLKCPAQYEWFYVLKKPRSSSPALERGLDIHKKAENYVIGDIKGMPKELENFASEFKVLKKEFKKGVGFCEPDISFTSAHEPSSKFKTDYFIGFADFAHFGEVLTVIDYKTGKKYPEHMEQGHAYSMALLILNEDIDEVFVEFWYLDSGETTEFHYTRKELNKMISAWNARVNRMYSDKTFKPTPHKFCNWCDRFMGKNGTCLEMFKKSEYLKGGYDYTKRILKYTTKSDIENTIQELKATATKAKGDFGKGIKKALKEYNYGNG